MPSRRTADFNASTTKPNASSLNTNQGLTPRLHKGLYHDGLSLTYAHSFASPGNPGWQTADDKGAFYGDHSEPEAVAAGKDMLALACPMGEAGSHLIGVDMNGQRQWGLGNRVAFGGGRISLATDGSILWIANGEPDKLDFSTGAVKNEGKYSIWRCELKTGRYAPWNRKGPDGKAVLDLKITSSGGTENCRAIAWHGGKLSVIAARERRFLILDSDTGDTLKEWKDMPEEMTACAFQNDGTPLLAAGSTLYRADPESGKLTSLIDGLDDPRGVVSDKDGNLYISQRGKKQNVEVFDADGKKLRHIGKPGGRPAVGLFDEDGMLDPAQIAIDSKGRLWVTESTMQPKRTSVWSPDGDLLFDLIGTTGYAAGGIINPFDHTRGIAESVEYSIDYEKQTFRPLCTMSDAFGAGFQKHAAVGGKVCRIVRVDGREYAQAKGSARDSGTVKLFMRKPDGTWRHVAEWGNAGIGKSMDEPHHREWNKQYSGPLWDGLFGRAYLWVDRNGDGKVEREEIDTREGTGLGGFYWGQMLGEDLSVAIPYRDRNKKHKQGILVFKPKGFSKEGIPDFSFDAAELIDPKTKIGGEGMLALGRDGRVYLNQSPLTAVDTDGKVLWTYPNRYVSVHGSHHAPAASSGLLIGPSSFYGTTYVSREIGEVFYLNGNLGQNFIFTEDGLWVQSLYNDCRGWYDVPAQAMPGMPCDAMTAGGESFGGGFCKSDDGKYYTIGGGTAAIVMEVAGLDSLRRFGMEVKVEDADIAAAQDIKVKRAAAKMGRKVYAVRADGTPLAADGNLDAWAMEKNAIEIQAGRDKVGVIKAAYDSKTLYLAYKVNDRSPLKNAGQDENLMFITGDCVDLMLRTDPGATGAKPVKGDLRIVITMRDGKPLAVVYRPVVPGTPEGERIALSSPWRSARFDEIKPVEFPLALKKIGGGYAVTAAVPLDLLGLKSLQGKTLRGDFGILRSDSAGQECTSRNYWSNKAANNCNDVPDEAMLSPALWGELRFE